MQNLDAAFFVIICSSCPFLFEYLAVAKAHIISILYLFPSLVPILYEYLATAKAHLNSILCVSPLLVPIIMEGLRSWV